jgi:hypothetical protein
MARKKLKSDRSHPTILKNNIPEKLIKGFVLFESIGIGIINPYSISKIEIIGQEENKDSEKE